MSEYTPSLEERRSGAKAIEAALNQCGISVIYALSGPSELFDVASILLTSQWLADHDAKVRAEERERCARIAQSSTRPLPGHGSFNAGSRSEWYASGVQDAAARIRGAS